MSDSSPTPVTVAPVADPSTAQAALVPSPTPLAQALQVQNPALVLRPHNGALTPVQFLDENAEISALLQTAGAFDLGCMAQVAVTGEDRLRWLNGMVSNAVQMLPDGHGNYHFILNAQGRIQGDAYIYREPERLLFVTTRSQVDRLIAHLDHFIIMDDVELRPLSDLSAVGLAGPQAAQILEKLGISGAGDMEPLTLRPADLNDTPVTLVRAYSILVPRFELWFQQTQSDAVWRALLSAGALSCGVAAVETLRVVEGIPAYGSDITDRHLAQETSQARALNFNKGCYLGQEIVERIRSRAQVHRYVRQFELLGEIPAPGAELRSGDKETGSLSSVASLNLDGNTRIFAIGSARAEHLAIKSDIQYSGGTASPLDSPPHVGPV